MHSRLSRLALAAAIALVAVVRAVPYPGLRRGDLLLLPGNDPYHYRTVVDELQASADGLALAAIGEESGEPLFYAVAYWTSELFGEAGLVWLPVAAAVLTAVVVAWIAWRVTSDERVTILSVALLAVYPMHLQYTAVGVVDHHALDYLLLAVTVAALLNLQRHAERAASVVERGLAVSVGLMATAVAASMLAWEGAPLVVLAPIGVFAFASAVVALAAGRELPRVVLVLPVALVGATVLSGLVHLLWSWQAAAVVLAPGVAGLGLGMVTVVAVVGRWRDWSPVESGTAVVVAPVPALLAVSLLAPGLPAAAVERGGRWLGFSNGINEAQGLFGLGSLLTLRPLTKFGVLLVWAVPALIWVTVRAVRRGDLDWLALSTVGTVLGLLSVFQIRFAGEWTAVLPLFAAVGLLEHLSRLDGCVAVLKDGGQALSLPSTDAAAVVLLVVAIGLAASWQTAAVIPHDSDRAAAVAVLDERGGEQTTVLARWDTHRLYNYHASGEGRSYQYATEHYAPVVRDARPPPERVDWIVVDRDRLPSGFETDWHVGEAERVWQQGDVELWDAS